MINQIYLKIFKNCLIQYVLANSIFKKLKKFIQKRFILQNINFQIYLTKILKYHFERSNPRWMRNDV